MTRYEVMAYWYAVGFSEGRSVHIPSQADAFSKYASQLESDYSNGKTSALQSIGDMYATFRLKETV